MTKLENSNCERKKTKSQVAIKFNSKLKTQNLNCDNSNINKTQNLK